MHASKAAIQRPPIDQSAALLGGLTAARFMSLHWQKKPLLIRQAMPNIKAPLTAKQLFKLATQDHVRSRMVSQHRGRWHLTSGPFKSKQSVDLDKPNSTLLVQGVDRHVPAARRLLDCFRFIPDARLDDVMISIASKGGGVGPHFDSYDVFLLQVQGRRRWQIGRLLNPECLPDAPLKILRNFQAEEEWVLEPGDMLYLPPRWAHDGVALDACMTCSIGFRSPALDEFAQEVIQRVLDRVQEQASSAVQNLRSVRHSSQPLYADPKQAATSTPGLIPQAMQVFADKAIAQLLKQPHATSRALGEWLSEPDNTVWFEAGTLWQPGSGLTLDPSTRMLYDEHHVFINGQSYRLNQREAVYLQHLANQRSLSAQCLAKVSTKVKALLEDWAYAGWLR